MIYQIYPSHKDALELAMSRLMQAKETLTQSEKSCLEMCAILEERLDDLNKAAEKLKSILENQRKI